MNKKILAAGLFVLALGGVLSFILSGRSPEGAARVAAVTRPPTPAPAATAAQPQVASAVVSGLSIASNQTATARGTKPVVVTCTERVQKPVLQAIASAGGRTVGALSPTSVLVEADEAVRARLAGDGRFESVAELLPSDKVSAGLAAAVASGAEELEVAIVTLAAEDKETVRARVLAAGGEMLKGCLNARDSLRAKISADAVARLASCGDVRWMESFVRPHLMNDMAVEPSAMNVRSVWQSADAPEGLSGAGQIVTTSDSGIDTGNVKTMHKDLADRVVGIKVVPGCDKTDVNGHGTHTAGSIVGTGAMSDGQIRGTAWGASLYAWFCGGPGGSVYMPDELSDLLQPDPAHYPAFIHSASWGSDMAGAYTTECRELDEYCWSHPDYLPVFAAGNAGEGGRRTIGSPAAAKNVLAVGATQNARQGSFGGVGPYPLCPSGDPRLTTSYSSRGPCGDGRIKPDIAAPGSGILSTRSTGVDYGYGIYNDYYAYDCGTSMACPLTAGAVALLREWLMRRAEFTDATPPSAALMKAVITGGARGAATPDNDQGWGRVDLAETICPSNRAVKLVDRIPFAANAEFHYVIETTNAAPLEVQLAWIDYPGEAAGVKSSARLVNDLDLTVERLTGEDRTVLFGNGGAAPDTLNNLESVRVAAAEPNKYLITVTCSAIAHDYTEGGAAALYVRGAFDPEAEPEFDGSVRNAATDARYFTLDEALAEAGAGEAIEILQPVRLRKSWTLPDGCTICATNADPAASAVTAFAGAALEVGAAARLCNVAFETAGGKTVEVSAGGTLSVSNVSFTAGTETPIVVADGGRLGIAGRVVADGSDNVAGVSVAGADGLVLEGELLNGLTVACPATARGETFGTWTCSYEAATNCAAKLVNAADRRLGGTALQAPAALVWDRVTDPATALAYMVEPDGKQTYYAYLDDLFIDCTNGAEIVMLRDCSAELFQRPVVIDKVIALSSSEDARSIVAGAEAGFTVENGGRLVLSNVTFAAHKGCPVAVVKGGAELVMEDGARIEDVEVTGSYTSGAVDVRDRGVFTMRRGASIAGCIAHGSRGANGGAVCVKGGATFNFEGGEISGCTAPVGKGGGVYTISGAAVNVSGEAVVRDCTSGSKKTPDNLYAANAKVLTVVGPLTNAEIGVSGVISSNAVFGVFGAEMSEEEREASAAAFANDVKDMLAGYAEERDGAWKLVWDVRVEANPDICPEDDLDNADAMIVWPDGSSNFWYLVGAALAAAEDGCEVVVLKDADLVGEPVEVCGGVTLRSAEGTFALNVLDPQFQILVPAGSELTVTNLVVSGSETLLLTPFIKVGGGALNLADAKLDDIWGFGSRAANAVTVWNGGKLRLSAGAAITRCVNLTEGTPDGAYLDYGYGGGILAEGEGTEVWIEDSEVSGCSAKKGGGVAVSNHARLYVSGATVISGNSTLDGEPNDLVVDDLVSTLVLKDALSEDAAIGFFEGVSADTNVFGVVDADFDAACTAAEDFEPMIQSAAKFVHNARRQHGVVVSNATEKLLVWNKSVAAGGTFTNREGEVYGLLGDANPDPDPIVVPVVDFAFVGMGNDADGGWTLSLRPGVRYCVYTLYTSDDLKSWEPVGEPKTLDAADLDAEDTFTFTGDGAALKRFWKVVGEDGVEPID